MKKIIFVFLLMLFCLFGVNTYAIDANEYIATKTQSDVTINNEEKCILNNTAFLYKNAGYCIEGNNYYKLRSLAQFLDNTQCKFNILWNERSNSIEIYTGTGYDTVGNELSNSVEKAQAYKSNHKLYVDGKEVELKAYTINGNNYFKLRDLSEYLGFAIDYDYAKDRVIIVTPESEYYKNVVISISETKINNLMDNNIVLNAEIDGDFLLLDGKIYNDTTQDIDFKGELFLNNGSYAWYPHTLSFDEKSKEIHEKIVLNALDSYYAHFYISYFKNGKLSELGPKIAISKENGKYYFAESKLENTLKHINFVSLLSNPLCYINENIDNDVVELANKIVGQETDKYRKLEKLYLWIAENIVYDFDYSEGRNETTYFDSKSIITHKKTVCDGYSTLLQDFLNSQGIPCVEVHGESLSPSNLSEYVGHSWNIAFINNRWIFLDVTWDSAYGCRKGEIFRQSAEGYIHMWFDRDVLEFENGHKL